MDNSSSAALHALKRQQLVSLSKKYHLRASGKVSWYKRSQGDELIIIEHRNDRTSPGL